LQHLCIMFCVQGRGCFKFKFLNGEAMVSQCIADPRLGRIAQPMLEVLLSRYVQEFLNSVYENKANGQLTIRLDFKNGKLTYISPTMSQDIKLDKKSPPS